MSNDWKCLNNDEVISINTSTSLGLLSTFKVAELVTAIAAKMRNAIAASDTSLLNDDGKNCQVLTLEGGGWKNGKIRAKITIEFCPDEPRKVNIGDSVVSDQVESPLDDIRRMATEI